MTKKSTTRAQRSKIDSLRPNDDFQSSKFNFSIVQIKSMGSKIRLSTNFHMPEIDTQRPKIDSRGSKNKLHDAHNDWLSKVLNQYFEARNRNLEAQILLSYPKIDSLRSKIGFLWPKNRQLHAQNRLAQKSLRNNV